MDPVNVLYVPNLKFVASPVPEIIGVPKNLGSPTLPFLQYVDWAFVRAGLVNVLANFEVRSFSRSWVITIAVLGFWVGLRRGRGRGGRRGRGWYGSKERWWVPNSYRHSIVTFPLSTCTPVFPHPISSLPKISPCFPVSRCMAFGLRSAKVFG